MTVLIGLLWILTFLFLGATVALAALLMVRLLAQFDILWTVVREGQAKAILQNEKFWRAVLSKRGHDFRVNVDSNWRKNLVAGSSDLTGQSDWDIIEIPADKFEKLGKSWPLLGGIYWVGLPPWRRVHNYRFFWTSLEQKGDPKTGEQIAEFKSKEEKALSYILIQQDMYAFHLKEAETNDLMGVDLDILVTLRVINPRRALFAVNKWLETTINILSGRIREYIGQTKFETIIRLGKKKAPGGANSLSAVLQTAVEPDIKSIGLNYGVEILKLQVFAINPSDDKLKDVVVEQYRARQFGLGTVATARAEADATRLRGDAANAVALERWHNVGERVLVAEANARAVEGFKPEQPGAVLTLGGQGPVPTYQVGGGQTLKESK